MTTKTKAIQFATNLGWSKEDAKRAYEANGMNLKLVAEDDEFTLALALAGFAGKVLVERQRKQARQRGEVTKKEKRIKEIQQNYAQKTEEFEKELYKERSLFVTIISRLYKIGQRFGLSDPWIEALLLQYQEYIQDDDIQKAA